VTAADPVWITEAEVTAAVTLRDAVEAVRQGLAAQHEGAAGPLEKTAVAFAGTSTLHALGGFDESRGVVGTKTWAHTHGGASPLLVLWNSDDGAVRAVIEAFALGQLRTAAISAVATDVLAPTDASTFAIIGTGKQALAQVAAVACVRRLDEVRVFSPTPEHRERFCDALRSHRPGFEVVAATSLAAAVDGAAVVTTATRATEPFLDRWGLAVDVHVNAVGAITPERQELRPELVAVADRVVSDSPSAAGTLSSELDLAERVESLADAVADGSPPAGGVSVFKAMGLGVADIAVGAEVLERVLAAGGGRPLDRLERAVPDLWA